MVFFFFFCKFIFFCKYCGFFCMQLLRFQWCVYTRLYCVLLLLCRAAVCVYVLYGYQCVSGVGGSKDSALCMCVSACLFGLMVMCVCVCVWVVGAVSLGCYRYQPLAAVRQLHTGCQIIPVLYANVLLSVWFQEECTGLLNRGAQPAKPWLQQLREQLLFSSLSLSHTLSRSFIPSSLIWESILSLFLTLWLLYV